MIHLYVKSKKKKRKLNLFTRWSHRLRVQISDYQAGADLWGEGYIGNFGLTCTYYYIYNK